MSRRNPEARILELRRALREHERRYYILEDPVVSDEEYDLLLKRLEALESEHPEFSDPDSPTRRVGGGLSIDFKPVLHGAPMLSLDNTYNEAEVRAFSERVQRRLGRPPGAYAVEAKIDGVSCSLTYEKGRLALAATRGDGRTGEDVTANARTLRSVPLVLEGPRPPSLLELRGEIYLEKREFGRINRELLEKGEEPFVNPRNCASGSLRQKDARVTASRRLRFFAHSLGRSDENFPSHWTFLERCRDLGFAVCPVRRLCPDIAAAVAFYRELESRQESLPYEIDGLVVKVDARGEQRVLGETSKSPRWAVAFKYPGRQATTRLKAVAFSVSRAGTITPVAELDPVFLAGVTISSATLHNFAEVERLGLRVGDAVVVERAGEVIPKIVKTLPSKRTGAEKAILPPKRCPACGGSVEKDEDLVAYRCLNPSCPAQLKRSLLHFASRPALDIEGLGEAAVDQLVDRGMISDCADLFRLEAKDWLSLDLFAEKKAANLLSQLEAAKTRPLSRLLYALGIRQVGERTAADLAARFKTLDALRAAAPEELSLVRDVGPAVADSIARFFSQKPVAELLDKLKKAGVRESEPERVAPAHAPLAGKTFVFTGELASLTRAEAAERVRALGGDVLGSVSRKTSFVVVGAEPGSKARKAEQLGVAVLSEDRFLKLLEAP